MSKTLREAELNGVRCRWNPDHHCGQVWNEATQTWWTAYHFQLLDHAAVFTALRAQPYEPEPDPVVSAIYAVLEKTWDSADNTPTVAQWNGLKDEAKTLAATIRPLVLASATVDALVGELVKRGARRNKP